MNTKLILPSSKAFVFITSFLWIIVLCQTVNSQSHEKNNLNKKETEYPVSFAKTDANNLPDNIKTEWVSNYASGLLESIDITTAMTCDNAGNVYVTGYSGSLIGTDLIGVDYHTVKYDVSGNQIWTAEYKGPGNTLDEAQAIAVDNSGNVYVTGFSEGYATIKYNSEGLEEWVAKYDGGGNANAIAVDGSGNIYVTGWSKGSNTSYDFATIKYNPEGVEEWVAGYNGPGNSYDIANAIAVDDSGNVYVTGYSEGSNTGSDYATIKYSSDGVEQWVSRYNGPGNNSDESVDIKVDGSGNIYVTGYSKGSNTSFDYATIKYNSEGAQQWEVRYNGPMNAADYAYAIAIDKLGNIYVTGFGEGYATIKYNSEGVEEWVAKYYGGGNAYAIAVDDFGNIYVTGESIGTSNNFDYTTIKYNSEGSEEWVTRYNGSGNLNDKAIAIAIDGLGNIFVAGSSEGSNTNFDYATVKYNSEGVEEWVAEYDGPRNSFDQATAIAVDDLGNIYVTGYSKGKGYGIGGDYATAKYNSKGEEEWVARYDGLGNSYDEASAIAVDGSGNIYVTGRSEGSNSGYDYATVKYNPEGIEEWVARYDGPGNEYDLDFARAISVDDSGNIYVTGYSEGFNTSSDYATIKYNSEGVEEWVARYNGPGNGDDITSDIAVDKLGNVYVTGYSKGVNEDYATIKYNSKGVEEWVARYNGSRNLTDRANAIAIDGLGNIYVTGYSYGTVNDFATIKYNSEGVEEWVARYNGPGDGDDVANAIAVDNSGNIYVTGYSKDPNTGDNYTTIKYNSQGAEKWIAKYNGPGNGDDKTNAITVDDFGNIYVTGESLGSGTFIDFATIRYSSEGSEDWVARYNSSGNSYDRANAIAVDGSGNVYVTGTSQDNGSFIYTTIKYSQGTVNIEEDNQIETYTYHLSQNFPNPYNPTTTIEYEIPRQSNVKIDIYDVLGRNIKTILNKEQSAGNYKLKFDGSKLSSGIYFYKITAGSFVQVKKMILLK